MAAMSALDAFSIDAMLPALDQISSDLNVVVENRRQYVITSIFLGFSIGVLFYGFVADRFGRKKPVIAGFLIYCFGALTCVSADSFSTMLVGRVLQGIGAAGPYVLAIAIVRDTYKGEQMARMLSLIMMVFIGVPMIAPFVGQGLLLIAGWRSIFVVLTVYSFLVMIWFWARQPETLLPQKRQELSVVKIKKSVTEVVTHPVVFRYTLVIGLLSGAFIAYLSTAQQIFQEIYQLGVRFPVVFASLASVFGIASFINSRLVETLGAAKLVKASISIIIVASAVYLLAYNELDIAPPLAIHIAYVAVIMFCFAFLFGNTTSLAMEPMGHIAGAASSVFTSLSTLLAIIVATAIGSQIDSTGHPLVIGFAVACLLSLVLCVSIKDR